MQLVLLGLWFCLPFFSFKLIAKFCLYSPINLMPGDSVVHQTCASFEMKNLCSQIMCVQGANEGPLTSAGLCFSFGCASCQSPRAVLLPFTTWENQHSQRHPSGLSSPGKAAQDLQNLHLNWMWGVDSSCQPEPHPSIPGWQREGI